jgi:hypothetical protein
VQLEGGDAVADTVAELPHLLEQEEHGGVVHGGDRWRYKSRGGGGVERISNCELQLIDRKWIGTGRNSKRIGSEGATRGR